MKITKFFLLVLQDTFQSIFAIPLESTDINGSDGPISALMLPTPSWHKMVMVLRYKHLSESMGEVWGGIKVEMKKYFGLFQVIANLMDASSNLTSGQTLIFILKMTAFS